MNSFSQIRATNLRDRVVEQIRTAIIEGHLKPNDHIVENYLTEQFGVSRTPVREALILLEREGLVVSIPHRGTFVRAYTEQDVLSIFSMRINLENMAGRLTIHKFTSGDHDRLDDFVERQRLAIVADDFESVRSIDMAFHRFLVESSEHPLLVRYWTEIVAQIAALLYIRAEAIPTYDEYLAVKDHQGIIDAYKARDLSRLEAENQRINDRVANECRFAVNHLQE